MCVCMTMLNEAMAFVLKRASIQMKRHTTIIFLLAAALALTVTAADEQGGRCPALKQWGICPTPATKCNEDEDCIGGIEKCCATACGHVCVKPLYTGCEQLHMEAERQARALPPSEGSKVRIPVCDSKGEFDSIQCDKSSPKCWCVDAAGFEIPGTRAPARGLVNCSNPKPCAGHTCRMLCPHGFALDDDGCPLCQCHDPCSEIKCPRSLSCELEDVACVRQPCPPVPRCKRARSLENVCPAGDPLTITGSERPFLCGNTPGKPRCPPMFECFVQRGHDYGVCCPASLKLQKPGTCPAKVDPEEGCGMHCEHDLECPSMQKCCSSCIEGNDTVKHCTQPQKVTTCLQMRMLSTLLVMREREGKGYLPQCSPVTGHFEPRQCSRNGLVCWCVDPQGNKIPGSMGPSDSVKCDQMANLRVVSKGRSIAPTCDKNICAQVCEYGFKVNENGCPTCECDNPCDGYPCGPGEECVAAQAEDCSGFLCPTYPQCRPKLAYLNPCKAGTPLTDAATGNVFMCNKEDKLSCPDDHICVLVAASGHSVCCPQEEPEGTVKDGLCPFLNLQSCSNVTACQNDSNCPGSQKCCFSGKCGGTCTDPAIPVRTKIEERPPSMCEYLRDFSDKMEGTQEGMALALLQPKCHPNGSYESKQCAGKECWCVDNFGTEIPKTRTHGTELDCEAVREELGCLDLTCRLGCDYGFILDPETRCPLCECRNPCEEVTCPDGQSCQMVEVNCEDQYCSPVPACLPKKIGQCPYLIPVNSGSCDYECKTDLNCNGTAKCCSNGCGTQCVEPVVLTACQHQRAILEHKAHETGIPARQLYIPQCQPEDGSFEPVQCHPASRQCWCVDKKGNEIPGTRAPPDVQPSCQAPSSCPMRKCQSCEHGYQMDASGCQTCQCRDPCKEISCRGEGEACRLVKVACVDGPCPPVPMCLPQRDNPCQNGHPLLEKGSMNVVRCGPNTTSCPSSHKCHLSPIGEFAVCCPKPRDVCFEPKDIGPCQSPVTRWYFNPEINKCELFEYGGCAGNQNNFESESICNAVCPVLSQCERLREKNQKVAQKYKKVTFAPRCDPETGDWEPIQCLEQVGVCWCVNRFGEPLKGSLTSGMPSTCNFRQARRRMDNEPDFSIEELLKQVAALGTEKPASVDNISVPTTTRCQAMKEGMAGTNAVYAVECDANGRFLPTQCYPRKSEKFPECWCVDEAGNQLPNTTTFRRGAKICLPTPVELVEVRLGFQGRLDGQTERKLVMKLRNLLQRLGAKLRDDLVEIEALPDMIFVRFEVVGGNKVDVAYHLEEMVKAQKLIIETDEVSQLVADITSSRFSHRLSDSTVNEVEERVIALEHREIVSQSTVSVVTPYQTAIIVLSVASAFVICILVVLIALYRKKLGSEVELANSKSADLAQRFLPQTAPIYVVSLPPHVNNKSSAVTGGKAEIMSPSSEQENLEN